MTRFEKEAKDIVMQWKKRPGNILPSETKLRLMGTNILTQQSTHHQLNFIFLTCVLHL